MCNILLPQTEDDGETDLGSTHAESGMSGEETDSDIGGITFTAVSLEEIGEYASYKLYDCLLKASVHPGPCV